MKLMRIINRITNCTYNYSFDKITIKIIGDILHVFGADCHDIFNLKNCTYELVGV